MSKLVVNFYGAPSSGKTVAAASTFSALKRLHIDAVLVNEFAHHKVVEENQMALSNQIYIWANQQYHIHCGYHHSDLVITDSPILLGAVYNSNDNRYLKNTIIEEYHKYNNFNIVMTLDETYPYSMVGRSHSLTESKSIENQIFTLLDENEIQYIKYKNTTEEDLVTFITDAIN